MQYAKYWCCLIFIPQKSLENQLIGLGDEILAPHNEHLKPKLVLQVEKAR